MTAVALKGLAGRKLRAALTALSIVLGVAMISGTFVLTDTIKKGFDTIFSQSYRNTDAVVTGKVVFARDSNGNNVQAPSLPASILPRVRQLPGVAAAAGSIADQASIVGRNGKTSSTGGAPTLAFSVDPRSDQRFNPLTLVSGRWPSGSGEVAIDKATADKQHFAVGDTIGVATREPLRKFRISGVAKFGSVASIGGATFAIFDVPTAQALFSKQGKLDAIRVAGKAGVSTGELIEQIAAVLPAAAQVRDAAAQAKEDEKGVSGFISFLQKALLAFAGVALFVGAFVIANTLSITIAQRVREFATLRTLGATRKQVLGSVILEALVTGIFASVVGLFVGFGLAKGLDALFVKLGIDLPKSSAVFASRTIVVSLLVGILITLVASLRPALRATRVPPIAAVREGSVLPPSRLARFGPLTGLVVMALGIALVSYGAFVHHISVARHLVALGGGVLLLFFGVTIFAPRLVRPLAAVLGWPSAKLGGAAGELARENAVRNPNRTASTAAALMIGLALVTFVTVFAQGLRSSFENAVDKLFTADYALTSTNGFTPLTSEASKALRDVPGVTAVSAIRAGSGEAFGKTINVTGVDRNLPRVIRLDWAKGSRAVPTQLGANGAFTDKDYAKKHHLTIGSPLPLITPDGTKLNLVVKGVFDPPKGGSPFGPVSISQTRFDAVYPNPTDLMTLVSVNGGVSKANTATLEGALKGFPDAKVATEQQFKHDQEKFILNLLNILYVLLGLSVIISLFGIVNTLVLTVFERTREIGMLRAVGMTRRQVRRMIRAESIVTALIGATLGIALGVFLGFMISRALESQGIVFAVPWGRLVVFAIAAVVVGVLAAILPARRASRLNVLQALQYE
jgi:putative ABC transport system permease protein